MAIVIMCSFKKNCKNWIIKPDVEVKTGILAQLDEHFKY